MKNLVSRTLFVGALALAAMTQTSPVLAQASLGDNALSYTDQDFISQVYQEIVVSQRLASLAVNDGRKGSVRSLAANVTDSLRQARETVKVLARKKGVTVTDELTAQNQSAVDQLSNAGGDDFDRTYLDILLQFLPKILNRCESVAGTTQDPDLKALATSFVQTIQSRIAAVQAVKSAL